MTQSVHHAVRQFSLKLGVATREAYGQALAELVDLHFFCGFSFAEIAALRGVSDKTVQRDWRKARLLLHRTLLDEDSADA